MKAIHVGSMGGLAAAKRGECDVAGVHLMDAASGEYNRPFLTDTLELVPGYRRLRSSFARATRASRGSRPRRRSRRPSQTPRAS